MGSPCYHGLIDTFENLCFKIYQPRCRLHSYEPFCISQLGFVLQRWGAPARKTVLQPPCRASEKISGYQYQVLEVPDSWLLVLLNSAAGDICLKVAGIGCFTSSLLCPPCCIRFFFCVEEEGRTYPAKSVKIAKTNLNVSLSRQEKNTQFSLPVS